MGGLGSGQYQSASAKDTLSGVLTLNIFKLYREGIIIPNASHGGTLTGGKSVMEFILHDNTLILDYCFNNGPHAGQSVTCPISICETIPHYGGRRLWFRCPRCDRRCGKLHLAYGQRYYLCRLCGDLTYQSTRERSAAELLAVFDRVYERHMARVRRLLPQEDQACL